MHKKHASGLDQDTLDMRNQGNIDDAWEEWVAGRGEEPAQPVVRLFGRWTPSNAMVRWLLAVLAVILVGCTLLTLSSCNGITGVVEPVHRTLFQQDCTSVPGYCVPLASRRTP
jgi:hypothetical protein